MESLQRFFGGSPLWVLIRLAVLSVIVGVILAALHIEPWDFVRTLRRFFYDIVDSLGSIGDYFLLGAAIVFPIWLILRVLNVFGRGKG